ncbi:lipoate--protein ligase [Lachnospiraceae bacterium ZAX-1]
MNTYSYIEPESTDASFHFSVEEYCMHHFPQNEPIWMLWQADKCAMLGRNQAAYVEIDMAKAKKNGIQIVRRSSGGGTIFTDMGTLLYTSITPFFDGDDATKIAREIVAPPIVCALENMGVEAVLKGRNDILVDGKKISGIAQYIKNGRLCTHGSLLFDADLETLSTVLRVDEAKIKSKALRSIRSRVTNLVDYMPHPCTMSEFMNILRHSLMEHENISNYMLSAKDITDIEKIRSEKYANPNWNMGNAPFFTFNNSKRFPDGKVDVFLEVKKGTILSCKIQGDFLGLVSIHPLEEMIEGNLYDYNEILPILHAVDLKPYLGNISLDEFLSCLFN